MRHSSAAALTVALVQLVLSTSAGAAQQYTAQVPTNLTAEMKLAGTSCPLMQFTREIDFENPSGDVILASIDFVRTSGCNYHGEIRKTDSDKNGYIDTMEELSSLNNRSHWDKMYISNNGANNALSIQTLLVDIEYDNGAIEWTISGRTAPGVLAAPGGRLELANWKIRRDSACSWLGISAANCATEFDARFDKWTREFIFDLGKSGSDNDTADNPKYGDDESLCTETVSWYYYKYASSSVNPAFYTTAGQNSFKDQSVWGGANGDPGGSDGFRGVFKRQGRLYCFRKNTNGTWTWTKNSSGTPDSGWSSQYTTTPKPGDVVIWDQTRRGYSGHTMMALGWETVVGGVGHLDYIDGPRVNMNSVDMQAVTNLKDFVCIGRIPDND